MHPSIRALNPSSLPAIVPRVTFSYSNALLVQRLKQRTNLQVSVSAPHGFLCLWNPSIPTTTPFYCLDRRFYCILTEAQSPNRSTTLLGQRLLFRDTNLVRRAATSCFVPSIDTFIMQRGTVFKRARIGYGACTSTMSFQVRITCCLKQPPAPPHKCRHSGQPPAPSHYNHRICP